MDIDVWKIKLISGNDGFENGEISKDRSDA
jgi:hypothetical protein